MREVKNSLRRLDTDYFELCHVHRPSPDTDVEETLGALPDLGRQGKVRYIGSSSYSGSQTVEAQWAARERHIERFVSEHPRTASSCAASTRTSCPQAVIWRGHAHLQPVGPRLAVRPLAQGRRGFPVSSARFDMSEPANQRTLDVVQELAPLAEQAGRPSIELAIAFVLSHPGATSAIAGPRTMEQLESYFPPPTSQCPPTCSTASTSSSPRA